MRAIRPVAIRTRSNCAATVHAMTYFAVHALAVRPLIRLHSSAADEVGTRKSGRPADLWPPPGSGLVCVLLAGGASASGPLPVDSPGGQWVPANAAPTRVSTGCGRYGFGALWVQVVRWC